MTFYQSFKSNYKNNIHQSMKKTLAILGFVLSFSILLYLGIHIRHRQTAIQELKYDYSEINKVNYGIFNLQLWKAKLFDVFEYHINQFDISQNTYQSAEVELNKYLNSVYNKYIQSGLLFNQIFEDAEKKKSINKVLLKLLKDNLKSQIDSMDVKAYIPSMAKSLTVELKKYQPQIRTLMQNELVRLMNYKDKYDFNDPRSSIYSKYNCTDIDGTNKIINQKLRELNDEQKNYIMYFFFILFTILFIAGIAYRWLQFRAYVTIITLLSVILLLLGVSLPMIDIDARINSFVFNMYESDISFDEQVVFYQSKSIIDVTINLIEGKGWDLKMVGILIFCFSILFPFVKLVLGGLILFSRRLQSSTLAQNLIFYLGKWSMADVFVVALFMSFIGFNGLFGSQLNSLERNKGGFAIETVNYTSLSYGVLFFTSYCIMSIILGILIQKSSNAMKV